MTLLAFGKSLCTSDRKPLSARALVITATTGMCLASKLRSFISALSGLDPSSILRDAEPGAVHVFIRIFRLGETTDEIFEFFERFQKSGRVRDLACQKYKAGSLSF
jgi:transcriptional regulatory protein LevR